MNSDQPSTRSRTSTTARAAAAPLPDDHDAVSSDQKQSVTLEALMATMLFEFASMKTELASLKDTKNDNQ